MGLLAAVSHRVLPFGITLAADFPPPGLVAPPLAETLAELEERTQRLRRLENLYHKGQEAAWDGRKVLADALARRGPITLAPEKRAALTRIFAVLMWGELAAWETASYLAEHIRDNTEAKMAATLQTFDEARHFYVLRDYLKAMNGPAAAPPAPDAFVKTILTQIIASHSIVEKLVGMQLFVEHIAVHLFRHIAEVDVEPVLTELLPYFHRDESRHVALGKLYLPEKFRALAPLAAGRLQLYQLWLMTFMSLSIEYHQRDAEALGLDTRVAMVRALRDQTRMIEDMGDARVRKGALLLPKRLRFINRYLIRQTYPEAGEKVHRPFRYARPLVRKFAEHAEGVWARVA
jgi:hypothetical protein